MFNLRSKPQSPKIFVMTPEYVRAKIEASIKDSASMIGAAETLLTDERTSREKKKLVDFIKDERGHVRVREEVLTLIGKDSVACCMEELVEFNLSFSAMKPGIDPIEAIRQALAASDED